MQQSELMCFHLFFVSDDSIVCVDEEKHSSRVFGKNLSSRKYIFQLIDILPLPYIACLRSCLEEYITSQCQSSKIGRIVREIITIIE